jgi:nucleotide-binding universal stress UspA family protein
MTWKPIVVGVDASPEARDAAVFAVAASQRAATSCYLVHATQASRHARRRDRYPYTRPYEEASRQVGAALGSRVPAVVLENLEVHRGKPADVLNDAVAALGAELVVLGGKHHSTLGRWLGGSTAVSMARTAHVPLLVTVGAPVIRRVLLTLDPSAAARPAVAAAERYAGLFGARLRALSVVEPPAVLPEVPQQDTADYYRRWEQTLAREVWPLIRASGVDTLVRHGPALETILREAAEWSADLVVVASHGKGAVRRMLVGSVTEGLINHLPTSLLVVPAGAALVEPDASELITVKQEEDT